MDLCLSLHKMLEAAACFLCLAVWMQLLGKLVGACVWMTGQQRNAVVLMIMESVGKLLSFFFFFCPEGLQALKRRPDNPACC